MTIEKTGLPSDLYYDLLQTLVDLPEFESVSQLRNLFILEGLHPYRNQLSGENREELVKNTLSITAFARYNGVSVLKILLVELRNSRSTKLCVDHSDGSSARAPRSKVVAQVAEFRRLLITSFNLAELHDLCFDLGIDGEILSGQEKSTKARELIEYVQRRKLGSNLLAECRKLRPGVDWPDTAESILSGSVQTDEYQALGQLIHRLEEWAQVQSSPTATVQPGDPRSRDRAVEGVTFVTRANLDRYLPKVERTWAPPLEWLYDDTAQRAVGRKSDLQTLADILNPTEDGPTGRVVVSGQAGLGKSTLASLYVARYRDRYPGGVLWPRLGFDFRDAAQCQSILQDWARYACRTVDPNLQFDSSSVNALLEPQPPILVVLDDVWSSAAIQPLIKALAPNMFLLLTTRDKGLLEGVPGARHYELMGLPHTEAGALLAHELGESDESDLGIAPILINELIETLQGHSQALAIAASVIRGRAREERSDALRNFLTSIASGLSPKPSQLDRPDEPEQVSLALRISYDDLEQSISAAGRSELSGAEAMRRLRLLGAVGPLGSELSLNLIGELWGNPPETQQFLDLLVRRTLLSKTARGRYRQHALVQNYNARLLKQDPLEYAEGARRYREHVLRLAETMLPQANSYYEFRPHLPHLHFVGEQLVQELAEWLSDDTVETLCEPETHLQAFADSDLEAHSVLLVDLQRSALAVWPYIVSNPATGEMGLRWLKGGLVAARLLDTTDALLTLFNVLGHWHLNRGSDHFHQAEQYFASALGQARTLGFKSRECDTLNSMGWTTWVSGRSSEAMEYYEQALSLAYDLDLPVAEGTILNNIGLVYQDDQNLRRALEIFEQALPITRLAQDRAGLARIFNNYGRLYLATADPQRALVYFAEALSFAEEEENQRLQAIIHLNSVIAYLNNGNLEGAEKSITAIKCLAQSLEDQQLSIQHDNLQGLLCSNHGEPAQAITFYDVALKRIEAYPDELGLRGLICYNRASAHLALDDQLAAISDFRLAVEYLEQVGNTPDTVQFKARAYFNLGLLHSIQDFTGGEQSQLAAEYFAQSIDLLVADDQYQEAVYALIYVCGYKSRFESNDSMEAFFTATLHSHPGLYPAVLGSSYALHDLARAPDGDTRGASAFGETVAAVAALLETTSWSEARQVVEKHHDLLLGPQEQMSFEYFRSLMPMFVNILGIEVDEMEFVFAFYEDLLRGARVLGLDEVFRQAAIITEQEYHIYWWWGQQHRQHGNYDLAVRCLQCALQIDHKSAACYHELGMVYRESGQMDKALRAFDLALGLRPSQFSTLQFRATTHFELGNTDAAIADYDELIARRYEMADAHRERGIVALFREDVDQACACLEEAQGIYADSETAYWSAIATLAREGITSDPDALRSVLRLLDDATRSGSSESELINIGFWRIVISTLRGRTQEAHSEREFILNRLDADEDMFQARLRARLDLLDNLDTTGQTFYRQFALANSHLSWLRCEQIYLRLLSHLFTENPAFAETVQLLEARIAELLAPFRQEQPQALPMVESQIDVTPRLPSFSVDQHQAALEAQRAAAAQILKTDGTQHPNYSVALARIGTLNLLAGVYAEAETSLREAARLSRMIGGCNSLRLLPILDALGHLAAAYGRYGEASTYYKESLLLGRLAQRQAAHSASKSTTFDADTAAIPSLIGLAALNVVEGSYDAALSIGRVILALPQTDDLERTLAVARILMTMATASMLSGKREAADRYLVRAAELQRVAGANEHPDVAARLNIEAAAARLADDIARASSYCEHALALQRGTLQSPHPELALSLINLAGLYIEQGTYSAALSHAHEAATMLRERFGEQHYSYLAALQTLARIYAKLNQTEEAQRTLALSGVQPNSGSARDAALLVRGSTMLAEAIARPGETRPNNSSEEIVCIYRGIALPLALYCSL